VIPLLAVHAKGGHPSGVRSLVAAVAGLLLIATPALAKSHSSEALFSGPTMAKAFTAEVKVPTVARSGVNTGRIVAHLSAQAAWSGGRMGLLVLGSKHDTAGRTWLHVELPTRPNHASAWMLADFAQVRPTAYHVVVSISKRSLTLYRAGKIVKSVSVVVGAPSTPTPTGLFAVATAVPQPDPKGFYGPWVLHLNAFSDALKEFDGGPGVIGIHGRDGASLETALGTAGSHGCVRVDDAVVSLLAKVAGPGTPVEIKA
jgi:L,D-transpeptidase catalytic domain